MGHPALALLLILPLASGCARFVSTVHLALREPGEQLRDLPETVWKQYDCEGRPLPFLEVERVELVPRRLAAGGEFNQRLVYALCPDIPSGVVTGELETTILFRGRVVVREWNPTWDLKPGRWIVDAFVRLPEEAQPGVYAYRLRFSSPAIRFEETIDFAIDPGRGARDDPDG